MEKMNEIIESNAGLLTALLIYSEFTFEQAKRFLPHAARTITGAEAASGVTVLNAAARTLSHSTLLQTIDINALAAKAAIDPALARAGLIALLPKLLELSSTHGNGVAAPAADKALQSDASSSADKKLFCL